MKHILLLLLLASNIGFAQDFNSYNYNTQNSDELWDIIEYDYGYLLTGISDDSGANVLDNFGEPVLIKLSKSGNPIDTLLLANYGKTELAFMSAYSNGYFYVFGVTNPPNDSFRLIVTKYDTLFNLIQKKEYTELQGKDYIQLSKSHFYTDSTMYLYGFHTQHVNGFHEYSFVFNFNFNTMDIAMFKELPTSCFVTDLLIKDSIYYFPVWDYNNVPFTPYFSVRYDTAFNLLSIDTLLILQNSNGALGPYVNMKSYQDSLIICSGLADKFVFPPNGAPYSYSSIMLQVYDENFRIIKSRYFYYDSLVQIEASANNSFTINNDNEYFLGTTIGDSGYYINKGLVIFKIDSNLNTIWRKHLKCTAATMRIMNLFPTDDGGVLVLYWEKASINGAALRNSKLIKINSNGEVTSIIDLQLPSHRLSIEISPNPTTDKLNVSLLSSKERIVELRILDMQGKQILYKSVGAQQTTIDVNKFANGAYIIEGLSRAGKSFSAKFMKN